jgi:hypothetical protein
VRAQREELEKKNHDEKMKNLKVEKMEQSKGIRKTKGPSVGIAPIE